MEAQPPAIRLVPAKSGDAEPCQELSEFLCVHGTPPFPLGYLIVRSTIKADPVYLKMLESKNNIIVHHNSHVTAIYGDKFLSAVSIMNEAGEEQKIDLDGVFIEIGWQPNTDILDGFVALNEKKEIIIDINCRTSMAGVFAAGDVTSVKGKQIIIAAGDGAKAALEAHEYLMKMESQ